MIAPRVSAALCWSRVVERSRDELGCGGAPASRGLPPGGDGRGSEEGCLVEGRGSQPAPRLRSGSGPLALGLGCARRFARSVVERRRDELGCAGQRRRHEVCSCRVADGRGGEEVCSGRVADGRGGEEGCPVRWKAADPRRPLDYARGAGWDDRAAVSARFARTRSSSVVETNSDAQVSGVTRFSSRGASASAEEGCSGRWKAANPRRPLVYARGAGPWDDRAAGECGALLGVGSSSVVETNSDAHVGVTRSSSRVADGLGGEESCSGRWKARIPAGPCLRSGSGPLDDRAAGERGALLGLGPALGRLLPMHPTAGSYAGRCLDRRPLPPPGLPRWAAGPAPPGSAGWSTASPRWRRCRSAPQPSRGRSGPARSSRSRTSFRIRRRSRPAGRPPASGPRSAAGAFPACPHHPGGCTRSTNCSSVASGVGRVSTVANTEANIDRPTMMTSRYSSRTSG